MNCQAACLYASGANRIRGLDESRWSQVLQRSSASRLGRASNQASGRSSPGCLLSLPMGALDLGTGTLGSHGVPGHNAIEKWDLLAQPRHECSRLREGHGRSIAIGRDKRFTHEMDSCLSTVGICRIVRFGSDDTDARDSQGRKESTCSTPKLAHVSNGGKPGVRFLARSKRGIRSMPAWLVGGTRQRRRWFCASGWEETKEGAAV